jgi:endonuclease/exonuclease/phosphatase family metal-dependent hydrolase
MKTTLSVLSLNMFGAPFHPKRVVRSFMRNSVRKRFDFIAQEFLRLDPDIITLQEVYLFHTFRHLKKLLKDYPYVGYQRMFFGPRGGIVVFSKIPLEKIEYIDFKDRGNYTNKAITGQLTRKGVLLTKIKDLPLWILTTHLIQNSDYPWIENVWSEKNKFSGLIQSQLDQTASIVQTLIKTDMNVIITGDFNIPKRTNLYRNFVKDAGVIDSFAKFQSPTYHKAFIPESAEPERLDYIFYSSKKEALKPANQKHVLENPITINKEELYLSDHVGLMTTFSL